jgi:hypothetical protein
VGPINPPRKHTRARYIITAIEYLTKWVEARTVKDCSETTATHFIFDDIITRFGCPKMLGVEPDYLPDLEVFYFQSCLYPMKYLHPISMYTLPRGGVQRGGTPSAGSGEAIPLARGFGGK